MSPRRNYPVNATRDEHETGTDPTLKLPELDRLRQGSSLSRPGFSDGLGDTDLHPRLLSRAWRGWIACNTIARAARRSHSKDRAPPWAFHQRLSLSQSGTLGRQERSARTSNGCARATRLKV